MILKFKEVITHTAMLEAHLLITAKVLKWQSGTQAWFPGLNVNNLTFSMELQEYNLEKDMPLWL